MTMPALSIYEGQVVHSRLRPKTHKLNYRVFSLLIDLDRLQEANSVSRLFRVNGWSVLSFLEKDHGDGRKSGLKNWVLSQLAKAGLPTEGIRVQVLCYPRFFGYVFNPLTVYFCTDSDGRTRAMLYQVNNTMGERHTYVIVTQEDDKPTLRHTCDKAMYVSPFTPMQSRYAFSIKPPGEDVCVAIRQSDGDGPLLDASFTGTVVNATPATLVSTLLRHPLMTLKVIGGIHYEALRLWRKGVPVFRHEPQQKGTVSIVPSTLSASRSQ